MTDNQQPAVVFNYSVDDYSEVLLEGPEGRVINKDTLEPNKNVDALLMGEPKAGTYKLIIQQSGETQTSKTLKFEGPDPTVDKVESKWTGAKLNQAQITIKNNGDLPLRIANASVTARGDTIQNPSLFKWIPAGESATIQITPSYAGTITVESAGDVTGNVVVNTSAGKLTGTITKSFEGPKLKVTDTAQEWNGASLKKTFVTVKNTGDLPTQAKIQLQHGSDTLGESVSKEVPAGSGATFELAGFGYLYQASSGGNVTLDLIVNADSGFISKKLTHHVEPATVSLESMKPVWENGELTKVKYTVTNNGEVRSDFSLALTVNGEQIRTGEQTISPGETKTFTIGGGSSLLTDPLYTVTTGGSYKVRLTLTHGGESTSKTATSSFAGVQGSISDVSPQFLGNYNSDTSELTSLNFQVRNAGDVTLSYDTIRISIGGVTRSQGQYSTVNLKPGASKISYVTLTDGITVDNGQHELTIELVHDGETVLEETVTVST